MCSLHIYLFPRVYWRSNEDTGSALVQGGRVEGANRDTTAEIGENCYRYFTQHRLTREIIYTGRSLIGKMEDYGLK